MATARQAAALPSRIEHMGRTKLQPLVVPLSMHWLSSDRLAGGAYRMCYYRHPMLPSINRIFITHICRRYHSFLQIWQPATKYACSERPGPD